MAAIENEDDQHYTSICHACNELLGTHREAFLEYIDENETDLLLNDIILSDRLDKQVDILTDNRDELISQIEALHDKDIERGDLDRIVKTIEIEG